jgi:DNA-binding MarR family transcriptional regulator
MGAILGLMTPGMPTPAAAGEPEDPAAEAWRRIRSISHDPVAMAACHQITQETGLPLAPLRALLVLPLDEALPMRQLARRLGCDNSYVTSLVDALEQRGLAVREQHPADRRVKVIVLTGQGRELARRAQLADTAPPAAFAALSPAEIATLRDLLRKLDPGPAGQYAAELPGSPRIAAPVGRL